MAHGSTLYHSSYGLDAAGNSADGHYKIGSGWGAYLAVAASSYRSQVGGPIVRNHRYGLRNDGVLVRWTVDAQHTWRSAGSYPGFAAVKTMTQISRTSTYDTFLATTRGGALYTIRIPVSSPMKPVVKQVRASTWGAFDYLVAERCGQQSTLLTAIDKDAGTAYLYAVGHANGTATVIRGVGKIPGTFTNPLYYLITPSTTPPLYGE